MHISIGDWHADLWFVPAIILIAALVIVWRTKQSFSYLLCCAVFGIYLLFAIDKTFFPVLLPANYSEAMRDVSWWRSMNLIPFNFNFSELPHIVLMQIFQNILLTIPFGFGVSFVAPLRAKDFLWLVPVVGFGVEAVQLIIGLLLGFPYRIIDINDALLNALGIVLGYASFRLFVWLYGWMTARFSIQHRGLSAYVYEVASRAQSG